MITPGVFNLGDADLAAINAALVQTVITSAPDSQSQNQPYVQALEGIVAATLLANFTYGAGGTSLKAIIEVTLDQGRSWIEVARFAFATASAAKVMNLSGLTPKLAAAVSAALSDDTALDGVLGDRMRASIITVGTYTGNTVLSVRLQAR